MFRHPALIRIGRITTSTIEIHDLLKAWILVSLAFGILYAGGLFNWDFPLLFGVSLLTVGVGFLLHELAHKLVAQHYGCDAEFRAFDTMLWIAVFMSFFGVVLAAPGAVMISGPVGKRRNGIISVAGPVTNIALSGLFLMPILMGSDGLVRLICLQGATINAYLALFNMIPFLNLDGAKVWPWNKAVYIGVVALAGALMLIATRFGA